MGIAKIIADIMAGHSHEVREEGGTGIKAALIQMKKDLLDGKGGTGVFMAAEYKGQTKIRGKAAQHKGKALKAHALPFYPAVNYFRRLVVV
jgi:hypothetical protein